MIRIYFRQTLLAIFSILFASAQTWAQSTPAAKPILPYFPSLDPSSMDKSVDPCVDFYHYSCGGWQKNNPIPADQTSWDVYAKLYEDNLNFLRDVLEQAAAIKNPQDAATKKTGDFFASCMDEAEIEKQGLSSLQDDLSAIQKLKDPGALAPLVARLQLAYGPGILFRAGSMQDLDNSEQVIANIDQGGHTMTLAQLKDLAGNFDWNGYYAMPPYPEFKTLNVDTPDFFKEANSLLASEPLGGWKVYLRFHVLNAAAPYLSSAFVNEDFDFYRKYLRGAKNSNHGGNAA